MSRLPICSDQSETYKRMPRYVTVAKQGSLGLGRSKRVFVRDLRIAVFNDGGTLYAVDDTCTHVGGGLCQRVSAKTAS